MPDTPQNTSEHPDDQAGSHSESGTYKDASQKEGRRASGLKIGLVAAASAPADGLAAAWYYHRTVSLLQNHHSGPDNSNFGIFPPDTDPDPDEEIDPEI